MPRKVLASFETVDGSHCVDVFVREDGSFGFEEFRGETDGDARWQSLGKYAALAFSSGEAALSSAQEQMPWLSKSEVWRW
jgi:hypothetical protein